METSEERNSGNSSGREGVVSRVLVPLFLLLVFIIALDKIQDTDAWIHLSIGRLIFDLQAFPEKEMFVYPNFDVQFVDSYPFWLFGAICYLIYLVLGASGLVVFKASAVAATFFIMLRDSLKPHGNLVISVILMVAAVEISHYRFVLRPDLLLMVFLTFTIFSLNAYVYSNKKYIYALPFISVIWANSHTSINLMPIPFVVFIIGGIIERYMERKVYRFHNTPSSLQIRTIALIFLVSLAASLINPYFVSSYLYGPKVMALESQKTFITELAPLRGIGKSALYGIAAVILASFFVNRKRFSLIHLLLAIPFFILAFSAMRFVFLVAIVCLPVMARNISSSLESKGWRNSSQGRAMTVIPLAVLVLYFIISMAGVGRHGLNDREFGFGFNYVYVPKGAVDYMDRNGVYGRVINTYSFGQYIIWRSYPERTVFIDGKGYFLELLRQSLEFRSSNALLDNLHEEYGFNSILIKYAGPYNEDDELLGFKVVSHPEWALVYWDDISLLYIKRGGGYDPVVRKDEYEFVDLGILYDDFIRRLDNKEYREGVVRELARNIDETGSKRAASLLSALYETDASKTLLP
jgi:hypothetical protein